MEKPRGFRNHLVKSQRNKSRVGLLRPSDMNLHLPSGPEVQREFARWRYVLVPNALPPCFVQECRTRAEELTALSRSIQRTDGEFRLLYRVVTGEVIQEQWPELFALYRDTVFPEWIQAVTGKDAIVTSSEVQSAVNLNIMQGDSVYRWHFDAIPYTLLLYLTDVRAEDGGALQLVPACETHVVPDLATTEPLELWPTAGTLVLMDGTRCYHHVAPLRSPMTRFSIPMVYPEATGAQQRPAGLDSYLYESEA